MKQEIIAMLKKIVGNDVPVELSIPEEPGFGHYSASVAMRLAKARGKAPLALAQEIADAVLAQAPAGLFEKVEAAAPGFVNFWISADAIRKEFVAIAAAGAGAKGAERFGANESLKGKTVMVEYTDANPFKLFHIGHLMSNAIGESFARLCGASGASVIRASYQSDVGAHIAKAIWGMRHEEARMPGESASMLEKMNFLGDAYAAGSRAYEADPAAKEDIDAINASVYSRGDSAINGLYDLGKRWSLEYFETVYARLGTKFDRYYFESEIADAGLALVRSRNDIFMESDGAVIFPGEAYGLHTRVFVSSKGLPVYEAKELGLNKTKFDDYPLDLSVVLTGNEIVDYFKVLLKAMELVIPEVAARTRHVAHGMLRLPTGKMSSRTGDVITAESLLDQVKERLAEKMSDRAAFAPGEREQVMEAIAVGAIKYSILRQNAGQDIIFDFDKSLSFEGDSGPYLQYAHARLMSVLRKARDEFGMEAPAADQAGAAEIGTEAELNLVRRLAEFPDVVRRAADLIAPSGLATYLHKLAATANKFYETTPILKDERKERVAARLLLAATAASVLRTGLELLGIKAPEKI